MCTMDLSKLWSNTGLLRLTLTPQSVSWEACLTPGVDTVRTWILFKCMMYVCLRVRVSVCVCASEQDREKEKES